MALISPGVLLIGGLGEGGLLHFFRQLRLFYAQRQSALNVAEAGCALISQSKKPTFVK